MVRRRLDRLQPHLLEHRRQKRFVLFLQSQTTTFELDSHCPDLWTRYSDGRQRRECLHRVKAIIPKPDCLCLSLISCHIFNLLLLIEYRTKFITRMFNGNGLYGCYALAATIFTLGLIRDAAYVRVLLYLVMSLLPLLQSRHGYSDKMGSDLL